VTGVADGALLEIEALDVAYGDFQALFGLDIRVERAETVSIIGANGAGKSTLLKAIAGLVPPHAGSITYAGISLASLSAPRRVEQGISLVPEGRRIFPSLTVEENIAVGSFAKRKGPWDKERVVNAFPLLRPLLKRNSAALSGGEQQALAIARALMANPNLLLLDEVSLGLAPIVVKQVYQAIPAIKEQGTTVLLVEQDVNQALAVADRFYCLLEGRVSLTGLPADVTKEQITDGYFGIDLDLDAQDRT
jgi:branched-chain amino acid transport system ATP-binding protein